MAIKIGFKLFLFTQIPLASGDLRPHTSYQDLCPGAAGPRPLTVFTRPPPTPTPTEIPGSALVNLTKEVEIAEVVKPIFVQKNISLLPCNIFLKPYIIFIGAFFSLLR